jgi:hypothetical protein
VKERRRKSQVGRGEERRKTKININKRRRMLGGRRGRKGRISKRHRRVERIRGRSKEEEKEEEGKRREMGQAILFLSWGRYLYFVDRRAFHTINQSSLPHTF